MAGETSGNELQQITTSGVVTNEGSLTGEGGGITTGPGDSLWMTVLNPGEVDSVQLSSPGFRATSTDGDVYDFGSDTPYGSLTTLGVHPAHPVVGISSVGGRLRPRWK